MDLGHGTLVVTCLAGGLASSCAHRSLDAHQPSLTSTNVNEGDTPNQDDEQLVLSLEQGKPVIIPCGDVPSEIGQGRFIKLQRSGDNEQSIGTGSLLRIDYRNNLSYLDLLFPQVIQLGPDAEVPIPFHSKMGCATHSNAQLTTTGPMPMKGDPRMGECILVAGTEGASLQRIPGKNGPAIRLDEGSATIIWNPDYDKEFATEAGRVETDPSKCKTKSVMCDMRGELSFKRMVGDEFARSYTYENPEELRRGEPVRVRGLETIPVVEGAPATNKRKKIPDHTTLRLTQIDRTYPALTVEEGGLFFLDNRNGKQTWDVLASTQLDLDPEVMVPTTIALEGGFEVQQFCASPLTAKKIEVTLPPDYRGPIIVAGQDGAKLTRKPEKPGYLTLTAGTAWLADATGLDPNTVVKLKNATKEP